MKKKLALVMFVGVFGFAFSTSAMDDNSPKFKSEKMTAQLSHNALIQLETRINTKYTTQLKAPQKMKASKEQAPLQLEQLKK